MSAIPYERVSALLANDPSLRRTPYTLTGNDHAIYSYAKKIAWKYDGQWYVVTPDSSPTTNRHIRAVRETLRGRGLEPTIVDYETGVPL